MTCSSFHFKVKCFQSIAKGKTYFIIAITALLEGTVGKMVRCPQTIGHVVYYKHIDLHTQQKQQESSTETIH